MRNSTAHSPRNAGTTMTPCRMLASTLGRGQSVRAAGAPGAQTPAAAASFRGISSVSLLPQKHIVHDTAIGLQLPESMARRNGFISPKARHYVPRFQRLLGDLFTPFDTCEPVELHERPDAGCGNKTSTHHMRGYGDRLTPEADKFCREAARYTLQ